MDYNHDIAYAQKVAEQALQRMESEGISPTPRHFELWYVYCTSAIPELRRILDFQRKAKGGLTDADCDALHDQFLGGRKEQDAYQKANNEINVTLSSVSGMMVNVKEASSAYTETLENVSERIAKVKNPREIAEVLRGVVADTNKMVEHNVALKDQLDRSAKAVEELRSDLERVRREAMTDGLTGLANRKAFDESILSQFKNHTESEKVFTLLMVDIDHFKSFNDNYGHQVGDQVLRLVARTLLEGVKGRDIAARYGGEEFAILLPGTNLDAGVLVAESLRHALATKEVINRSNGDCLARITMSVGAAQLSPGEPLEDLIARADAALYTAKNNGRNQVAAAPTPHNLSKRKK